MKIKALITKDTYIMEPNVVVEARLIGILLIRKRISFDCVSRIELKPL